MRNRSGKPLKGSRDAVLAVWLVATLAVTACGPSSEPDAGDPPGGEQAQPAAPPPDRFGFGTPATHADIDAWDIDVMPDGTGLPDGEGTAASGAVVFAARCAACHGPDGRSGSGGALVSDPPQMAPPFGPRYDEWRGDRDDLPFTVGNYWPYATTLFDYIRRAMPAAEPGSLTADEVYGLVAWLLVQNAIIDDDLVVNARTLPGIEMPARDIFVADDRRGGPDVR